MPAKEDKGNVVLATEGGILTILNSSNKAELGIKSCRFAIECVTFVHAWM